MHALDELLQTQLARREKEVWLREGEGLLSRTAYALARAGDLRDAVVALERGRARLLAEALEQARRDLEHLRALDHADMLERYQQAARAMQALLQEAESPFLREAESPGLSAGDFSQAVETARDELHAAIDAIRKVPGYADFFQSWSFEKILHVAEPDAPLIYITATPAGGLALVVCSTSQAGEDSGMSPIWPIWLDSLTTGALHDVVAGSGATLGGFLAAYDTWRRRPRDTAAREAWFAALDRTTRWLWEVVLGPLVDHLCPPPVPPALPVALEAVGAVPGVRGTLIPAGLLSLLPLHAAWTDDPNRPTRRRYALDEVICSYAPNARALASAREIAARVPPDTLLAIDNPDGSLRFSRQEVEAVLSYFPEPKRRLLGGPAATRQAVMQHLPDHAVLHFSTHGWAGWAEPLESGLLMADKPPLTLRNLLDLRLPGARLAALSACETGLPGTEFPDEVIGLPTGLIQAGVAGVVASLWSVNDLSTAMLMERFYRSWKEGHLPPATALRNAQRWLRDTTNRDKAEYFRRNVPELDGVRMPKVVAADLYVDRMLRNPDARDYAHPFWWAAFCLTGI